MPGVNDDVEINSGEVRLNAGQTTVNKLLVGGTGKLDLGKSTDCDAGECRKILSETNQRNVQGGMGQARNVTKHLAQPKPGKRASSLAESFLQLRGRHAWISQAQHRPTSTLI